MAVPREVEDVVWSVCGIVGCGEVVAFFFFLHPSATGVAVVSASENL